MLRAEHANGGPLLQIEWWRVVLDEAHRATNASTAVSKACCALQGTHRWCVTGTPMQNAVLDFFGLLKFLRVPEYGETEARFKALTAGGDREGGLRSILRAIMLRRLKSDTFGGKTILPLPAKHVEIVSKDLSLEEKRIFAGLAECARVRIHSFLAAGTLRANYMNVLSMLTRLRQACDSPVLVESAFSREEESIAEESTAAARERAAALATGAVESCQLCSDQVQRDGGCVTSCGHAFCYECVKSSLSLELTYMHTPAPSSRPGLRSCSR